MTKVSRRLLLLIADEFPTHRPDVSVLFGETLPRHGILCDVVAQLQLGADQKRSLWPAGQAFLCERTGNKFRDQIAALVHDVRILWKSDLREYDAIQVRDKVFAGILGQARAVRVGKPFFFWMSFPMSEGFIEMARRQGLSLGVARWAFLFIKGHLGRFLLYRFLLPRCDHVFVQSERMAHELVGRGIAKSRMTPVPMGVDVSKLAEPWVPPKQSEDWVTRRPIVAYLGTLERARRVDFLFEVLAEVRRCLPDAVLLLVGDATEQADQEWLRTKAVELGVSDAVIWTGWVPTSVAWSYLSCADIAVSIVPRGELFDCASPTKVVEYLALGLPVVANDQPDQHQVLTESSAGISVPMNVSEFAMAISNIWGDESLARNMREAGPRYVKSFRSYSVLGEQVAAAYSALWSS